MDEIKSKKDVFNIDLSKYGLRDEEVEEMERKQAEAEKPKALQFVKPTVEEIDWYCKERRNGIDAQQFFDFYEFKCWKVGVFKMKDWRACVRTWEKRYADERHKAGGMWGGEKRKRSTRGHYKQHLRAEIWCNTY